jgi:hypothetical protein
MQYNFEVRTALSNDELQSVTDQASEGLEASSQIILEAKIRVNTELPDEKVESLRQAVGKLVTDKLATQADTTLISQEH